jgi:hypothetical protein
MTEPGLNRVAAGLGPAFFDASVIQAKTASAMLQQITRPTATKGTDANEPAARPELDETTTLAPAGIFGEMVVHWQSGKGK